MPKRSWAGKLATWVAATVVGMAATLTPAAPAFAQRGQPLQLLTDAETDHVLRAIVKPIWRAAGLSPDAVRIVLVNDRMLNAFVMGGQNIFLNTGLLLEANPEEFAGVVAHESGHISGGHLVRGSEAVSDAMIASLIGLGLGVVGGVAARDAGAGMGGVLLGQQLAQRSFLAFSRTQEASADAAGMSFLERSGISSEGMLTFLQKLNANDPAVLLDSDAGYARTHPLTPQRIEAVKQAIAKSRFAGKLLPAADRDAYERIQAKLFAFIDPVRALARFRADDRSVTARYGRAYAYFRRGDIRAAQPLIEALMKEEPKTPWFAEAMGDLMLQSGRAMEAIPAYRKATALAPDAPELKVSLAHALLETGDTRVADEAIRNLNQAKTKLGQSSFLWRLMAQAYAMKDNRGMVAYASAEESFAGQDIPRARAMVEQALKLLPRGSPGWLRAADIRRQLPGNKDE